MARTDWTVDQLHHALPNSAARQALLADVNLSPIADLPGVLAPWAAAAEQLEADRPRIEAIRAHYKEHGTLPDTLQDPTDLTETVLGDASPQRGAA